MTNESIEQLFNSLTRLKVGVVGDMMLDTYWWGRVERISPEAPVPIVAVSKREQRIGGAGNVALNIARFQARVAVISVLGDDQEGEELRKILMEEQIDSRYLLSSRKRITTNKIRIIGRNQQMMRLDAEQSDDLIPEDEEKLLDLVEKYISTEMPDLIILEDYNKGIFTENTIRKTIDLCRRNNVLVTVDPKRKHFFEYRDVDLFKPNLKEAIAGLNMLPQPISTEWLSDIHDQIKESLGHQYSLVTLSENGIFYKGRQQQQWIPAHKRTIADVSGAGDTVIAIASLILAASGDIEIAARIANVAGGIVCEEVGTVPVNKGRLILECQSLAGEWELQKN